MSLASIEKEHPIFIYNDAKIKAYRKDLESWIEPLAFNDETLVLKLICSFSDENGILRKLNMKFNLYSLFNRTMEEICTFDELGLFSGIKTSGDIGWGAQMSIHYPSCYILRDCSFVPNVMKCYLIKIVTAVVDTNNIDCRDAATKILIISETANGASAFIVVVIS
ncbi:hypothetical protein FRX31_022691 [Thalictrum thalictroides]|uniref:Uncharacterized protein n=1 Tax=Thalictrum thalictroides TaxID=46969 RepID=A0A7J6VTK7_THATH|nr:hypothetical protein FRX31_022691 [Thalictrum thalictroides]